MSTKSCQFLGRLSAPTLAALTALFRQASKSKQGAGRPAAGAEGEAAFQQPRFLRVGIVEVTEDTLQFLESAKDALEVGSVVKGRCDVDQVTQLLRADTDCGRAAAYVCRWSSRWWRFAGSGARHAARRLPRAGGRLRALAPDAGGRSELSHSGAAVGSGRCRLQRADGAPSAAPNKKRRQHLKIAPRNGPSLLLNERTSTSMSRGGPVNDPPRRIPRRNARPPRVEHAPDLAVSACAGRHAKS